MDPRYHRTPSPGQPLQHGYQLEDNPFNGQYAANQPSQQHLDDPYARQQHLDAPLPPPGRFGTPSDNLQLNAAVSFMGKASQLSRR